MSSADFGSGNREETGMVGKGKVVGTRNGVDEIGVCWLWREGMKKWDSG